MLFRSAAIQRSRLAGRGIADDETRTLVIAATIGSPPGAAATETPAVCLLDEAFAVDKEGFLVPRS